MNRKLIIENVVVVFFLSVISPQVFAQDIFDFRTKNKSRLPMR